MGLCCGGRYLLQDVSVVGGCVVGVFGLCGFWGPTLGWLFRCVCMGAVCWWSWWCLCVFWVCVVCLMVVGVCLVELVMVA